MTISSETSKNTYSGDDSTTVFPYTFKILDDDEVAVVIVTNSSGAEATQTKGDDYTVSGVGNSGGGNITFTTAPATGQTVVLKRNVPLTQLVDYIEGDAFPAETHEEALDRLTMICQQQKAKIDLAITLPDSSALSNIKLPDGSLSADKYLKWNSSGTALEAVTVDTLSGTFADVVQDTSPQLGGNLDGNGFNIELDNATSITDDSGNEYFTFSKAASAVNEFTVTNAATGNGPTLSATGGDTNIDINYTTKGTGAHVFTGDVTISNDITFSAGFNVGTITPTTNLEVQVSDTRTASIDADAFVVQSLTSNTPAAGIGTGITFEAESADESPCEFGVIGFAADDVTAGSEDTYAVIRSRTAGAALSDDYKFKNTGASNYIFTGAPASERTITLPDEDVSIRNAGIVQHVYAESTTRTDISTAIPYDDTIPQSSEGFEVVTVSITPTNSSNILIIESEVFGATSAGAGAVTLAIFQDSTADALSASACGGSSGDPVYGRVVHRMSAGTTSSTTFKLKAGPNAGNFYINGNSAGRRYGGVGRSWIKVTEIAS